MPSVDDLLKKNKDKLEKLNATQPRKKIVREGATRPWQVNLPQYNKDNPSIPLSRQDEKTSVLSDEFIEKSKHNTNAGQTSSKTNHHSNTGQTLDIHKSNASQSFEKCETNLNKQQSEINESDLNKHSTIAGQAEKTDTCFGESFTDSIETSSQDLPTLKQASHSSINAGQTLDDVFFDNKSSDLLSQSETRRDCEDLCKVEDSLPLNEELSCSEHQVLVSESLDNHGTPSSDVVAQKSIHPVNHSSKTLDKHPTNAGLTTSSYEVSLKTLDKSPTNARQTPFQRTTNAGHIAIQTHIKHEEIAFQTQDDPSTNARQTLNKRGAFEESSQNNRSTNHWSHRGTTNKSFESLGDTIGMPVALHFLSVQQRKIIDFLFLKCLQSGSPVTQPVSSKEITERLQVSKSSKETQIKRLVKNGYLEPVARKDGPGGWAIYRLNATIYRELISPKNSQAFQASPKIEMEDNRWTNHHTNHNTNHNTNAIPSSGSQEDIYIKTNTVQNLPEEWASIDFSRVERWSFTKVHFNQVVQSNWNHPNGLTPEQIQNSLDAFAYSLVSGKQKPNQPLQALMKQLRNRQEWGPAEGFKTRKTLQAEARAQQAQEEIDSLLKAEATEKELNYLRWKNSQSQEDQRQITLRRGFGSSKPGGHMWEQALRMEFKDLSEGA